MSISLSKRGSVTVGRDTKRNGARAGNAVRDSVPERNKRVEISSLALAHHVSVYVIIAKHFGAIAFHCICQVVQHAISSMVDAKEEVL